MFCTAIREGLGMFSDCAAAGTSKRPLCPVVDGRRAIGLLHRRAELEDILIHSVANDAFALGLGSFRLPPDLCTEGIQCVGVHELGPTLFGVEDKERFGFEPPVAVIFTGSFNPVVLIAWPLALGGLTRVTAAQPKRRPVRRCQFAISSADLPTLVR